MVNPSRNHSCTGKFDDNLLNRESHVTKSATIRFPVSGLSGSSMSIPFCGQKWQFLSDNLCRFGNFRRFTRASTLTLSLLTTLMHVTCERYFKALESNLKRWLLVSIRLVIWKLETFVRNYSFIMSEEGANDKSSTCTKVGSTGMP
jgi:hypothetical protein